MKYAFRIIILIQFLFVACSQSSDSPNLVFNEAAKSRVDSTLTALVEAGKVAGISALIYEKGEERYFQAVGYADKEQQKPMSRETMVQIYSMTKPITGTALMKLYEKGMFELDDPLEKYLPEFSNMKVYQGVDENGEMILTEADRSISVRDITRHTAGFPNRDNIPGLSEVMKEKDARNYNNTLASMAEKIGSTPLWFQPGTQWEYGLCVDVQAYLVEKLSGMPYGEFVNKEILEPLGMNETMYYVPEEYRDRMAAVYERQADGTLARQIDSIAYRFSYNHWPLTPGGFGLSSTIDDYLKFTKMLLNEGKHGDQTILQPSTVELMRTNHLPDSIKERSWLPNRGQVGFGIDFAVRVAPPQDAEENQGSVGEFFWDGALSTLFFIDPENELIAIMFVQLTPYDGIGLHKAFRDAVYGPWKPSIN
ncbi:class A beta-lactamase-related serine hydrolase [Algoriphagus kandeliae]|uniref:Class A beta-lactamase-related serine hydrolase n=1 Tax=Algoriphagus kandeliae TaxID=2562278 RepID=A0A4Y9R1L1_9BACT|nr:serine hydrolase domain-containing protein [Algoriphagus kandeliae]TFV97882.1 class A beta-lactamase-related serine hydrolase [Algoriphagus kandeliae]